LFQDMNSLYIVYNEKNHTRKTHTRKRIFIRKDIKKNKTRKKLI
jgi:phage terminase large subunit-like protein